MRLLLVAFLFAISYAQTGYLYTLSDAGTLDCPAPYSEIDNTIDCEEAANAMGLDYISSGSWTVPYGCVKDTTGDKIWFNSNEVNEVARDYRMLVCRVIDTASTEDLSTEAPTSDAGSTEAAQTESAGSTEAAQTESAGSTEAAQTESAGSTEAAQTESPQSTDAPESTQSVNSSTTGAPSVNPTSAPTPIPYRVFVKFISSYGCEIQNPRVAAMEWNFYDSLNATEEIASEFFDFTGANDSPGGETPDMLSDDNEATKWLSFLDCNVDSGECMCTNEIELHFTLMEFPRYYTFVSGDHGQLRDPAIWNVTFCCAIGATAQNSYGCGEPMNVNVFDSPWSEVYGPNLGRVEETDKFPMGGCEMGPSFAPSSYDSNIPSKTPTRSPDTSMPSAAPFSPSDAPSPGPIFQDYYEWNCTMEEEPTTCEEYTRDLTQDCDVSNTTYGETDYCCAVSDGSHYCCDYYDPDDPNNIWVGEDVARCTHTDSGCIQTCFKSLYDGTRRTCHKMCPDQPTKQPSNLPSKLCEDQDEVYSMNGTTYWDELSNKTMTCQQVIDVLFINNARNCTVHFARQCPVACNMCIQIPTQNPTTNPSRPPQEPSASPSFSPSRPPHPQCADDDPVIIGGIQLSGNCTELTKQLLQGAACSDSLARVCEKSCPNACTDYPSTSPITSPSTSPTTVPTGDPTSSLPSSQPSRTPSSTPSIIPSVNPTKSPNLECVDVDEVTFYGGQTLGFGIPCAVAVQVVFDNNDVCQGDLLRQCPDSCGTCTDEPSQSPTLLPSISCNDRLPVYDAEGQELPNLECSEIVFVLEEQFGPENPCTDHYALQCPFSCKLCTPAPTEIPSISFPSATPSMTIPTRSPTMNTTFVPSVSQQPSATPSHAGPYQCGESIAQCDIGFTTLFAALILCQNQAYEDCPDIYSSSTDCPIVDCPSSTICPDCSASTSCPDVVCPTCPASTNGGCTTAVDHVDTYDRDGTCQPATDWWVGQVIEGLDGFDPYSMTLCQSDGEYKISYQGRVYPTCVAYGDPTSYCTDSELVCPEHPNTPGYYGYAGNQKATLKIALKRNDFKHQDCPTIQIECQPLEADIESYWKDLFVRKTGLDVTLVENVCVNTVTSEVRYVAPDAYMNTCVGFSREALNACPTPRDFLCAGNLEGFVTYGWPGQIVEAIGRAVEQTYSKRHPQCPF